MNKLTTELARKQRECRKAKLHAVVRVSSYVMARKACTHPSAARGINNMLPAPLNHLTITSMHPSCEQAIRASCNIYAWSQIKPVTTC